MTRILWDELGSRRFSIGVDRGVLYLQNGRGVPWNGLVSVNEAPSGADVVTGYFDGLKYFARHTVEDYSATIEAFTYPLEFDEFDGRGRYITDQSRKPFGFSYRTLLGNDVDGTEDGYLIHLVYNAVASPSTKVYNSASSDVDLVTFSWKIDTRNFDFMGLRGSHLVIDSRIAYPWLLADLESLLYGSSSNEPTLPSPEEVFDLFEEASILKITDNGDGTWTADGPEEAIQVLGDFFTISWPSAIWLTTDTYKISSL